MDFHGLSRKELQRLCKKHGIPANMTNVAMADALSKLGSVCLPRRGLQTLCKKNHIPANMSNFAMTEALSNLHFAMGVGESGVPVKGKNSKRRGQRRAKALPPPPRRRAEKNVPLLASATAATTAPLPPLPPRRVKKVRFLVVATPLKVEETGGAVKSSPNPLRFVAEKSVGRKRKATTLETETQVDMHEGMKIAAARASSQYVFERCPGEELLRKIKRRKIEAPPAAASALSTISEISDAVDALQSRNLLPCSAASDVGGSCEEKLTLSSEGGCGGVPAAVPANGVDDCQKENAGARSHIGGMNIVATDFVFASEVLQPNQERKRGNVHRSRRHSWLMSQIKMAEENPSGRKSRRKMVEALIVPSNENSGDPDKSMEKNCDKSYADEGRSILPATLGTAALFSNGRIGHLAHSESKPEEEAVEALTVLKTEHPEGNEIHSDEAQQVVTNRCDYHHESMADHLSELSPLRSQYVAVTGSGGASGTRSADQSEETEGNGAPVTSVIIDARDEKLLSPPERSAEAEAVFSQLGLESTHSERSEQTETKSAYAYCRLCPFPYVEVMLPETDNESNLESVQKHEENQPNGGQGENIRQQTLPSPPLSMKHYDVQTTLSEEHLENKLEATEQNECGGQQGMRSNNFEAMEDNECRGQKGDSYEQENAEQKEACLSPDNEMEDSKGCNSMSLTGQPECHSQITHASMELPFKVAFADAGDSSDEQDNSEKKEASLSPENEMEASKICSSMPLIPTADVCLTDGLIHGENRTGKLECRSQIAHASMELLFQENEEARLSSMSIDDPAFPGSCFFSAKDYATVVKESDSVTIDALDRASSVSPESPVNDEALEFLFSEDADAPLSSSYNQRVGAKVKLVYEDDDRISPISEISCIEENKHDADGDIEMGGGVTSDTCGARSSLSPVQNVMRNHEYIVPFPDKDAMAVIPSVVTTTGGNQESPCGSYEDDDKEESEAQTSRAEGQCCEPKALTAAPDEAESQLGVHCSALPRYISDDDEAQSTGHSDEDNESFASKDAQIDAYLKIFLATMAELSSADLCTSPEVKSASGKPEELDLVANTEAASLSDLSNELMKPALAEENEQPLLTQNENSQHQLQADGGVSEMNDRVEQEPLCLHFDAMKISEQEADSVPATELQQIWEGSEISNLEMMELIFGSPIRGEDGTKAGSPICSEELPEENAEQAASKVAVTPASIHRQEAGSERTKMNCHLSLFSTPITEPKRFQHGRTKSNCELSFIKGYTSAKRRSKKHLCKENESGQSPLFLAKRKDNKSFTSLQGLAKTMPRAIVELGRKSLPLQPLNQ